MVSTTYTKFSQEKFRRKKLEKNFGFKNRGWERGDLVRIEEFAGDMTMAPGGIGVILGISTESDRQGELFPAFHVYDLKLQTAKKYYSYDLKLISPINT